MPLWISKWFWKKAEMLKSTFSLSLGGEQRLKQIFSCHITLTDLNQRSRKNPNWLEQDSNPWPPVIVQTPQGYYIKEIMGKMCSKHQSPALLQSCFYGFGMMSHECNKGISAKFVKVTITITFYYHLLKIKDPDKTLTSSVISSFHTHFIPKLRGLIIGLQYLLVNSSPLQTIKLLQLQLWVNAWFKINFYQ